MINATELRIGNWVEYKISGKDEWIAAPVFSIKRDTGKHFRPIELTPEILEKCGFKRHGDGLELWFLGEIRVNHCSTVTILRPCNAAGESQADVCGYPTLGDKIPCKYLHQLQNLYFALTGTELTINL